MFTAILDAGMFGELMAIVTDNDAVLVVPHGGQGPDWQIGAAHPVAKTDDLLVWC